MPSFPFLEYDLTLFARVPRRPLGTLPPGNTRHMPPLVVGAVKLATAPPGAASTPFDWNRDVPGVVSPLRYFSLQTQF